MKELSGSITGYVIALPVISPVRIDPLNPKGEAFFL